MDSCIFPRFLVFIIGLADDFESDLEEWKKVYDSVHPHREVLPGIWGEKVTGLSHMVIIRCIRPDKLVPAVQVRGTPTS